MGKKSTGESPYVYEGGSLTEQLREYIRWEEATRNLLSLLEAKGTSSHQPPQREPLGILQSTWDSEDSNNFKDVGSRLKGTMNILGKWGWGEEGSGG